MIDKTVWVVVYVPDWDEFKTIVDSVHATMMGAENRKDYLNLDPSIHFSAQTLCFKIKE